MLRVTLPGMSEPLECSAALSHHWLVRRRGGEKVLEALAALLPGAPIYTLVCAESYDFDGGDGPPDVQGTLRGRDVRTSPLAWLPGVAGYYPRLLPLMPLAARAVKLPAVDLVVCSDASVAKAMRARRRTRVVCYCHSPVRYAWQGRVYREYRKTLPRWARPLWGLLTAYIRQADRRAARRVDLFVANSAHVAARIKRCYGREAVVVHPPVELPPAPTVGPREDFLLCVGHHVPYKRLDIAVEAARGLRRRLIVIGTGPDIDRLRLREERHVTCMGWQSDEVVRDHFSRAAALLFPGEEDFGIVPVEAMAHGCPVVAYGRGGACETVVDGVTGMLFPRQTGQSLIDGLRRAEGITWDPVAMFQHAQRFSYPRFLKEMREVLGGVLRGEAERG